MFVSVLFQSVLTCVCSMAGSQNSSKLRHTTQETTWSGIGQVPYFCASFDTFPTLQGGGVQLFPQALAFSTDVCTWCKPENCFGMCSNKVFAFILQNVQSKTMKYK